MSVSNKPSDAAATPAIKSPSASDRAASPRQKVDGEIADHDLDNVSGGPTSVERNHTPT